MNWINLSAKEDLDAIVEKSHDTPCLIFKHSTRCSISSMAKSRLEMGWPSLKTTVDAYYLDLIKYRELSQQIAQRFEVHHESPQFLLIKNGECVFDGSHSDVRIAEVEEGLNQKPF